MNFCRKNVLRPLVFVLSVFLAPACGNDRSSTEPPPPPPKDLSAPALSIIPPPTATNADSIQVRGTAFDDVSVVKVTARLGVQGEYVPTQPTVVFSPGASAPFTISVVFGLTGENVLTVEASDAAGNVTRDSVRVLSDRTAPWFRAVAPFVTSTSHAVVAIYGQDVGSKTVEFSYSINGDGPHAGRGFTSVPSTAPFSPKPWVFADTLQIPVPLGTSTLTITGRDLAGNVFSRTVQAGRGVVPEQMVMAPDHLCMLMPDASARCLGMNDFGQLGDGATSSSYQNVPVSVAGGTAFTSLAVGYGQSCGITPSAQLYCWGRTPPGAADAPTTSLLPRQVLGIPPVQAVAAGDGVLCILTADGHILCWGGGSFGQLGDGAMQDRVTPALIAGDRIYTSVVAHSYNVCALTAEGEAYCWGRLTQPSPIQAASKRFTKIVAGYELACGLESDGWGTCWGYAGIQPPFRLETPEPLQAVADFFETGCAVGFSKQLYCWGVNHNFSGESWQQIPSSFADPFIGVQWPPVRSLVGIPIVDVVGSSYYMCAKSESGAVYCFGENAPQAR